MRRSILFDSTALYVTWFSVVDSGEICYSVDLKVLGFLSTYLCLVGFLDYRKQPEGIAGTNF